MATKSKGCLIGCGAGCLILLIAAIAMFAGGAWWFKDTMSGFDQALETSAELDERFGDAADFTPAADGSIGPERIEAFLAIRAESQEGREKIAGVFERLPMSEEKAREIEEQDFMEKMGTVFGITTSALGLAAHFGDFYEARNAAFARHDMGLGEYTYIYVLAYYNFLGKPPEDGPLAADMEDEFRETYRRVRRDLIANLENQLAVMGGGAAEAAPGAVEAEIEAMREDRYRIPWQDGLPPAIAGSLEPFRERLEASYYPQTNIFELGQMERKGRFTIEVD